MKKQAKGVCPHGKWVFILNSTFATIKVKCIVEVSKMDESIATKLLDDLRDGNIVELFVKREDFLVFRSVLVKRDDFKHFRGIAQRGGHVIYRYLKEPRS